jgi:cell wall-associated NlpC family hydrolase
MQQRFAFRGPRAPTIFLNEYIRNPGRFGLLPGDPIYFLNPRPGVPSGHVAMYIGNGQIIHATIIPDRRVVIRGRRRIIRGRRGVIREPLITALRRYARGRDRFRFVGLGRVRATITT